MMNYSIQFLTDPLAVDLIQFVSGPRTGEYAVIYEWWPALYISDLNGDPIINWNYDRLMYWEENQDTVEVPEAVQWREENRWSFPPIPDGLLPRLEALGRSITSRLDFTLELAVGVHAPKPS